MTAADVLFPRVAELLGPLLRLDRHVALTPRARLIDDLGLDSLDRQSLACELDEAFAIEIPDDDVASWCTLADVTATVLRLHPATGQAPKLHLVARPDYAALGLGSAAEAEARN